MKKDIQKKAYDLMKYNKVEKLYHTSDGNFFLNENSANNHAIRLHGAKRDKKLKVTPIMAEAVGLKTENNTEKTVESLMNEFDILSAKKDEAVKKMLTAKEAKVFSEKELKESKKEEKTEKEKILNEAETKLKEAEKEIEKINVELEQLETEIDKTE